MPLPTLRESSVTQAAGWSWQEARLSDGHTISGMREVGWDVQDASKRIVQAVSRPGWTLTEALDHWQRTKPATEDPQ